MNINFFKKFTIIFLAILATIYAIFLLLPFIISPIVKSYIAMVNDEVKKATGFESKIEGFKIVTTPKLTVGANLGKLVILTPDNKEIFVGKNLYGKMSLLPLLAKKIEIDLNS